MRVGCDRELDQVVGRETEAQQVGSDVAAAVIEHLRLRAGMRVVVGGDHDGSPIAEPGGARRRTQQRGAQRADKRPENLHEPTPPTPRLSDARTLTRARTQQPAQYATTTG